MMKLNCIRLVAWACLAGMAIGVQAAERWHGVSVFGPEGLKYKPGERFEYLNPDAPIAGRLRMSGPSFSKLNPFGLTGSAPQWLEEYCFEALGIKSWDDDEAYSVYGLIAESFELADDKSSLTIRLRPEARFADGEPVTADDVVFSYELLFDPDMNPALRLHMKPVERFVKLDAYTVRVDFKYFTRDLPVYVSRLVIYPRHIYGRSGVKLGEDFREVLPVGSGPYQVAEYKMGEQIRFERRGDYWGRELPYTKGYLNWKEIEYQVYFDGFSEYEALKSGLVDFKCWFQPDVLYKLDSDGIRKGYIERTYFPITRPAAMKCMVFNLRKPLFQDIELRKVLISLYDFDTINRNFHYGDNVLLKSYFDNQPQLRAADGPAKGRVREILSELAARHNTNGVDYVPQAAFDYGPREIGTDTDGKRMPLEMRVFAASKRLDELGWIWDTDRKVRVKDGQALSFEIMIEGDDLFYYSEICQMAGVNARTVNLTSVEVQNRRRNFRFDCDIGWFDGRKAPGRELARHFLSSEADVKGSANRMGLKNPAIDELLDRMSVAEDRETVETYAKVFDRIMCNQWYLLPRTWPTNDHAVYWRYLRHPEKYASGLWTYYNIRWFWWFDQERYDKIQEAIAQDIAVQLDESPNNRTSAAFTGSE